MDTLGFQMNMPAIPNLAPVTKLKREATKMISSMNNESAPMIITENGKPTAVLMNVEVYEKMVELLELRKRQVLIFAASAKGRQDVKNGKVITHKHVKERSAEKWK